MKFGTRQQMNKTSNICCPDRGKLRKEKLRGVVIVIKGTWEKQTKVLRPPAGIEGPSPGLHPRLMITNVAKWLFGMCDYGLCGRNDNQRLAGDHLLQLSSRDSFFFH